VIYEYSKCDTCRKALRFLDGKKLGYERKDITAEAPALNELETMLAHYGGDIRKLFNTSGVAYKEMKLSEKLPKLPQAEALKLLAANGRLVKRPFLLGDGFGLVGFKEDEWKKRF